MWISKQKLRAIEREISALEIEMQCVRAEFRILMESRKLDRHEFEHLRVQVQGTSPDVFESPIPSLRQEIRDLKNVHEDIYTNFGLLNDYLGLEYVDLPAERTLQKVGDDI